LLDVIPNGVIHQAVTMDPQEQAVELMSTVFASSPASFPDPHRSVFAWLVDKMADIVEGEPVNKMGPKNIGTDPDVIDNEQESNKSSLFSLLLSPSPSPSPKHESSLINALHAQVPLPVTP
jgi:hypothetical protein